MSGCSSQPGPCCRAFCLRVLQALSVDVPELTEHLGPDVSTWIDRIQPQAGGRAGPSQSTLALHAFSLHFEHACRHSACVDPACQLCKNNPQKTCTAQLRPKYVVGQEVAAPCGAPATVALAVRGSGSAAASRQWSALAAQGARLQVLLVDERQRQQRAKDLLLAGASSASSGQVVKLLRDSVVAFDPAGKPMLSCSGAEAEEDGSLLLGLQADAAAPCVALSGLSVGCSTERATSGRKRAPVRLAALLVDAEGEPLDVAPVLSPEFYVVSDRSENHEGMGGMLLKDSPVSQVRCIGKETVRRLQDIPAACSLVGVELELPEGLASVTTVGELAQLLAATQACAMELSQVLKLSKGQLETAATHVATAVEPDTWLRVFLAPSGTGLLYTSEQGGCTLAEPAAVLEFRRDDGGSVLPLAVQRLGPGAPELCKKESALQRLVAQAEAAWRMDGHPGWEVLQLGGNCFETFEELKQALPADLLQPVLPRLAELVGSDPTPAQSVADAHVQQSRPQQAQQAQRDAPQPLSVPVQPARRRARRPRAQQQQGKKQQAAEQKEQQQRQAPPAQPPLQQQRQAPPAQQQHATPGEPPRLPAGRASATPPAAPAQPSAAHASASAPAANPFAVAASAGSSESPDKRPHPSGSSRPLSPAAQQGSAAKRAKVLEAGGGQEGSGTAAQFERPSIESNNSQQGPLFALPTPQQLAALQQALAPQAPQQQAAQPAWSPMGQLTQWQQQTAQQQAAQQAVQQPGQQPPSRPVNPMPSVPRPPSNARAADEQQQANLLVQLLQKLSREQAGAAAAAALGASESVSWDWLASLGGALAGASPAQAPAASPSAAAAPPNPLASLGLPAAPPLAGLGFLAAQPQPATGLAGQPAAVGQQLMDRLGSLGLGLDSTVSLDFWTNSLEALAQLLGPAAGQGAAAQQPSFPPTR